MLNFLAITGRRLIRLLEYLTSLIYMTGMIGGCVFIGPFRGRPIRWRRVFEEFSEIGLKSLTIILVTGFSIGVIIVFVLATQLEPFGVEATVPVFVTTVLTKELTPLLTGLVLAGRVGASITAKIGTQKVNEEILALETMAIDPVSYIIAPRVIAAVIMLPTLTIIADTVGLFGGFIVGTFGLGIDMDRYWINTVQSLDRAYIFEGLIKSFVFGFIISLIGTFHGISVEGGSQEVGHATMVSVVTSTLLIIISHAVISGIMYAAG